MEFNFENMVNEAYESLNNNSSDVLVLPKIDLDINQSRLHWKNVKEFLKVINRQSDHFIYFLKKEMMKEINWYSKSKSDGLIIHGKFQKKSDISNLAIKYINNYVICSSCKKVDTVIIKENKDNIFECLVCGMKKFV